MASQVAEASTSTSQKTNAQILQEKHEAAEAHNPTVEDVVDEEDVQHPPPSSLVSPSLPISSPSEEAMGKQKAEPPPKKGAVLDTQSEELFPSLGGGSKARSGPAAAPAWGAKKPTPASRAAANGFANGVASAQSASSPLSSRASTPPSGILTPASSSAINNASGARKGPMQMAMPGKYTDSITLVPAQMDKSKPLQPYLDKLNKKSRATVTRHTARDGSSIVFEGSGPKKDVSEALRTIARELTVKQNKKLPIPASCRAHIIGQGGSVIKEISARTGAKIQVPRSDVPVGGQDDDDSMTIDVEIEGDPYAVELARLDIEKIVSARTSRVNLRLKDIPPEFFPFLAGPHDSRVNAMQQDRDLQIQVPHFHTWQQRPPPRVSKPNERPEFVPHPDMHIQISGDRRAAQEARAQIERQVAELRRELSVEDHAFQRGHHQFIIGERGMSLHDFLEETGCAVVLPPDHDDTEDITIIGPAEQLQIGVDRAATLAAEMQMANVDPRRYFADAPFGAEAHSRALSRYLQERQLEAEMNELYGTQVAFPPSSDPSVNWEIYSRDMKKSIQARSDLTKIIQAHPPAKLGLVEIDPFFHPHLRQQCGHTLRNDYGVNMIIPRNGESEHVILVCEGPEGAQSPFQIPRQRPSESEIAAFQQALEQARNQLLSIVGDKPEVATRQVEVPKKFHDKLQRYVDRHQKQTPQTFPVQLLLGEPRVSDPRSAVAPGEPLSQSTATLRGLNADVADLEEKIRAFVEEAKQDELERGYTTTFDFPTKFNGYLIGREGTKIKELRDQFDVDIRMLDDGKIEVKGPKAKADACQAHIIGLRKKYEDEATYVLKIEPRFHGQLVGKKGADVNRLQDKYNVKIQFPQSGAHDDQSNADTASEAGGRRTARSNQAQDEVVIRGPRQGADKARTEILDLYQYAKDNSHSATISVARQHLGSLIGQRGSEIERLRLETEAQIDFPDKQDTADPQSRAEIVIKGTKQAVDAAKTEIQKKVKVLDDTVTRSLEVNRKYHGSLIGAQGKLVIHPWL
jgi:transcription antitermination factor NusA-like protein